MAEQKIFDVVIVGGGPAGLTASIYTSRHNLKTLVIAKSLGGQMALTNEIENWPGSELTSGFELATKFKAQTEKWQTEFNYNEVKQITKTENGFVVRTGNEEFSAKAVVLAFGLTPRNLEVTGEEKLTGRGVSYCATCDGPFFRNKLIGIVGDGNAAVESLIYLSGLGQKIYLFHKEENLRAAPALIEKAKALTNTEFVRFQS
ncbi:MAG: FAD-dependent oxidoreductase, partial [bacterium]